MRKTNYYDGFQTILDKHPMMKFSLTRGPLSVNEVMYMFREEEDDTNISMVCKDGDWSMTPSVKHTFVPTRDLALKVKSIELDQEFTEDNDIRCITIRTY